MYPLKPSSQKKARTVAENKDEDSDRKPHACLHIPAPKQPNEKFGDATKMLAIVKQGASQMRDSIGRRQRRDCPVVMSCVISWPEKVVNMHATDHKAWRGFAKKAFRWLRRRLESLGATFGYAVEHLDESHPHFHAHFHNNGASIKPCHPGHLAGKRYKAAMSKLQDDFNRDVAAEFGLLTRSPTPRKHIHGRAHKAGIRILKVQRPPVGWKAEKMAAARKRRLPRPRPDWQPDQAPSLKAGDLHKTSSASNLVPADSPPNIEMEQTRDRRKKRRGRP